MLLDRDESTLLVVDIQEKLAPHVDGADSVVANAARLIEGAARLAVPVFATEQYPAGLGRTVSSLAARIPPGGIVEKTRFAAGREPEFRTRLAEHDRRRRLFVVLGMETHVCVLQTALSLRELDFAVAVVADAVGSRRTVDRDAALRRLERNGVELVTTEMVLFEWLRGGPSEEFRALLPLIR
jgi:nicotinamidase-related amidase